MCWTQAKFALPFGGTPCRQRWSSVRRSPPQSFTLKVVGEDEVGLEVRMSIVVEAVAVGNLALDAAYGEVHPGETPSRVVRLLPPDGDVAACPTAVPLPVA